MLRENSAAALRKIAGEAARQAGRLKWELTVRAHDGFLTRMARNEIHQNSARRLLTASLRLFDQGKSVRVYCSDASPSSLRDAVDRAKNFLAAMGKRGKDLLPAGPQVYRPVGDFDPAVREETPAAAARFLAGVSLAARARQREASGYYSADISTVYVANAGGLEAYHRSSGCRFGMTVRRGSAAAYASRFHFGPRGLDKEAVLREADERLRLAGRAVRLRPGRYDVIFSPRALSEFLSPLYEELNGRKVEDRNSFFSGKRGRRLFSPLLTIEDDVYHAGQTGLPFDGDGMPRRKVRLIERGVVKNFVYDRKAARDLGVKATGHAAGALEGSTAPANPVIYPGSEPLSALIGRGPVLLVSHLWYHNLTWPGTLEVTGVTKGSALLWNRGECEGAVSNARYLETIPEALRRIAAVSREQLTVKDREYGASRYPYVRITGFRFI